MRFERFEGPSPSSREVDWRSLEAGALTPDERAVLQALKAERPALATTFLNVLPQVRREAVAKLFAAFWRENACGFADAAQPAGPLGAALTRALERAGVAPTARLLTWPLGELGTLLAPVAEEGALRRLRFAGPPGIIFGRAFRPFEHPSELLRVLATHSRLAHAPLEWAQLGAEQQNHCANWALARAHAHTQAERWSGFARERELPNTLALVAALASDDPSFRPELFFEQLVCDGHPLHPCAKTRVGLTPEALLAHGPEFEGRTEVRFVALARSHAGWTTPGAGEALPDQPHEGEPAADPNAALFAAFPALRPALEAEALGRGLALEDYVFVPVHPWQASAHLGELYAYELAEGFVVPLEETRLPSTSTAAFRTVAPDDPSAPWLKLALDAQMTSSNRSISPQTAHNGPLATRLLRAALAREPQLACHMLAEEGGVWFEPWPNETASPLSRARRRNLTTLWRESVSPHVAPGELAICGAALLERGPVGERPLALELVEAFAAREGLAPHAACAAWLEAYAQLLVPIVLTFLTRYGIGLEAHLQNSVPIFEGGRPVRVLLRDWGGLRLGRDRLAAQGLAELADAFMPESLTLAPEADAARRKAFYTLYQNHLGPLIAAFADGAGADEAALWGVVGRISGEAFDALAADPACAENARADRDALFAPELEHKALTLMRLFPEGGDRHVPLPNPLAGSAHPLPSEAPHPLPSEAPHPLPSEAPHPLPSEAPPQ